MPQGRTQRLWQLGRTLGGMAAGAAVDGLQQWASGEAPTLAKLMLTPANAQRLAERLSAMRGAAMKLGQVLSMDGHGVLPPALADLLARLRDQAHAMPATQLVEVLEAAYGADWAQRFRRLSFQPVAAASIGQVHRAETHDGRVLALKLQYPGVRQSIDSDIANLALLARTPGLLPPQLDVAALLARVREQLLRETDYAAEAAAAGDYRQRLADDPQFIVPAVVPEHCSAQILAMDWADGRPLADMAHEHAPQPLRDRLALALARLSVREVFELRRVQSDPNFANYLYQPDGDRIVLLDFGATLALDDERVAQWRALGRAQRSGSMPALAEAARAAGYVAGADDDPAVQDTLAMLMLAGEPMRHAGAYDFGASDLVARVLQRGQALMRRGRGAAAPPADMLYLQRKFVGTFLMCVRLRARVDMAEAFGDFLDA